MLGPPMHGSREHTGPTALRWGRILFEGPKMATGYRLENQLQSFVVRGSKSS